MDEESQNTSQFFSNRDLISELEAKTEFLTDEILNMMVFSDI